MLARVFESLTSQDSRADSNQHDREGGAGDAPDGLASHQESTAVASTSGSSKDDSVRMELDPPMTTTSSSSIISTHEQNSMNHSISSATNAAALQSSTANPSINASARAQPQRRILPARLALRHGLLTGSTLEEELMGEVREKRECPHQVVGRLLRGPIDR